METPLTPWLSPAAVGMESGNLLREPARSPCSRNPLEPHSTAAQPAKPQQKTQHARHVTVTRAGMGGLYCLRVYVKPTASEMWLLAFKMLQVFGFRLIFWGLEEWGAGGGAWRINCLLLWGLVWFLTFVSFSF